MTKLLQWKHLCLYNCLLHIPLYASISDVNVVRKFDIIHCLFTTAFTLYVATMLKKCIITFIVLGKERGP